MTKNKLLATLLLLLAFSGLVGAETFVKCKSDGTLYTPTEEQCDARNTPLEKWQPAVDDLIAANRDFQLYARDKNPPDMASARKAFNTAKKPLIKLTEAAEDDLDLPVNDRVSGSAQLAALASDLRPQFAAQGLPTPDSLDAAFDLIDTALVDAAKQGNATILAERTLNWGIARAQPFVLGLASTAGAREAKATLAKKDAERQDFAENGGYVAHAAKRFGLLSQIVPFYSIAGLLIGGFLGTRKKRPRLMVKVPALAFVLSLAVGLLNVLIPLPGWLWLLIAAGAGFFLWFYTERFWSTASVQLGTHGSARWALLADMLSKKRILPAGNTAGFTLGRAPQVPETHDSRFRYMGHVLTCAPTGSGKGIGAVIPNLLEYPGSALVLDIKGENYAVTSAAREAMGHKVFVLDPFAVTGKGCAFNWLDMLDVNSPDVVGQASALADMLVVSEKAGDHWDETAKELLRGLLVYTASLPIDRRHMGELRRLITGPVTDLEFVLEDMAASDAAFGVVARTANAFLAKADKERSGVLSSAIRHTAFLDDPRIAASLQRSDFDLSRLKAERMTIYIVIPPARLAANTRYMRGFIGLAFEAMTRNTDQPAARVAFFLDEFAQLGYMKSIEDAVGLLRGYGLAFWFFLQDLSQLKAVYPKWQTFLANSAQQYFGTNDYDTAKYISDMLGQSTIEYNTEGRSRQDTKPMGSSSESQHYHGRSLLTPDEVLRLGPEKPVVLIQGESPYLLQRLNYRNDPEYAGKAQPNPYHA